MLSCNGEHAELDSMSFCMQCMLVWENDEHCMLYEGHLLLPGDWRCMCFGIWVLQDETFYDGYNTRWASVHGALSFEPFRAKAEAFKAERIYPHIATTDSKDMINAMWLHNLTDAQYRWAHQAAVPGGCSTQRPEFHLM